MADPRVLQQPSVRSEVHRSILGEPVTPRGPARARAPAADWDAVTAALAEPSAEEWYCYDTDSRETPLAGPQVIEDWSVLTAVLRETAELSTADGWVEGFEPPQGGGWTTDQAAANLRLWVTRRFRRGDARLTDVPRHPDS